MNLRGQKFYLLTICFLVLYLYDCIEWQLWSSKDKAVMQLLTWITFVNTFMHAYQIHLWLFLVYNVVYFNSIRVESSYICFLNNYRSVRILLGSSSKFTVEKRAGLSAKGGMNYWFKLPPRHIIFFKFWMSYLEKIEEITLKSIHKIKKHSNKNHDSWQ